MSHFMLVIDQGNTLTKMGLFNDDDLIDFRTFSQISGNQLNLFLDEFELNGNQLTPVRYSILSSVVKDSSEIEEVLSKRTSFYKLSSRLRLPFLLHYETPETLGHDRIAAVAGAMKLHPGQDLLVIDAGTCITYDFINKKGEYKGGGISPGIHMRIKALHTFTGKLPLVDLSEDFEIIGTSTVKSILSGVGYGIIEEVNGIIARYESLFPKIKIILTGGESKYFDKYLKNNIFAVSNLVLTGLKDILKYNVEN